MKAAFIVSAVRTPVGKAPNGRLRTVRPDDLAAFVIKEVLGETVTMEELGGAKIHSEVSGVTDLVATSDDECLLAIRKLLGFLPSNFESMPPRKTANDDPARSVEALEKIVPEDMKRAYNIIQVIKTLVDDSEFFELKAKFARNLVIGFGRLDGAAGKNYLGSASTANPPCQEP